MDRAARRIFKQVKGLKEYECSCASCRSMCGRPCTGTPGEMERIIKAGLGGMLERSCGSSGDWRVDVLRPKKTFVWGACVFQDPETGLCALHERGLKPIEGRVAIHQEAMSHSNNEFERALDRSWSRSEGKRVLAFVGAGVEFDDDF